MTHTFGQPVAMSTSFPGSRGREGEDPGNEVVAMCFKYLALV